MTRPDPVAYATDILAGRITPAAVLAAINTERAFARDVDTLRRRGIHPHVVAAFLTSGPYLMAEHIATLTRITDPVLRQTRAQRAVTWVRVRILGKPDPRIAHRRRASDLVRKINDAWTVRA